MAEYDLPPKSLGDNIDLWVAKRLGKATASNIWRIVKRTKTGWSAERHNYKIELICERLTGMRQEVFLNAAMLHGVETEPDALRAYGADREVEVSDMWFVNHPRIGQSGASPDGAIGADGLIECKCPLSRTHIETMLTREIPERYQQQMMWQLACTKRRWVDFVSFDNRLPHELRLFVQRFYRDDEKISEMESIVAEFLDELDADMRALGSFTPLAPKKGDGREPEPVTGWSDNLSPETFSGIGDLMKAGLIKRGL